MPGDPPLNMVRLALDARRLAAGAKRLGLPPRQEDLGALVHATLAALFGEGVVQPFRVLDDSGRSVPVLGYSALDDTALREHASSFADPESYSACDFSALAVKPMPDAWAPGRRLGFELRACPVVRLSSAVTTTGRSGEAVSLRAGAEIDAWVHARWLPGGGPEAGDRSRVYGAWLGQRLEGAADLVRVELQGFRRTRLVRRTHGGKRKAKVLERPDALLSGELEVGDAASFARVLAGGIGRHRAYGFGMLLLRPPG